jgi:hypothetical protein
LLWREWVIGLWRRTLILVLLVLLVLILISILLIGRRGRLLVLILLLIGRRRRGLRVEIAHSKRNHKPGERAGQRLLADVQGKGLGPRIGGEKPVWAFEGVHVSLVFLEKLLLSTQTHKAYSELRGDCASSDTRLRRQQAKTARAAAVFRNS